MNRLPILAVVFAVIFGTPLYAHHEVLIVSSMMPLFAGVLLILLAAVTALRKKLRWSLRRGHLPVRGDGNGVRGH